MLFSKIRMAHLSLVIVLLLHISLSHASQELVPCASVDLVQTLSSKLDAAIFVQNKWIAYSSTPVLEANNLWWFIGVGDITAKSTADALKIGREILRKAAVQLNSYAILEGNEFICSYGEGYIQARGKKLYS